MKTLAALFTFCYLLFSGFPGGASGEELSTNAGDIRDKGSKKKKIKIQSLGQEDSPGGGPGHPLQYSCLRITWTEEPGGLHSTVSHRLGHN